MKRIVMSLLLTLIIITASSEIFLRVKFGFCDAPLAISDSDYEYAWAPQDRTRFGNHIYFNAYSMRSEEVDTTAKIILGLGDSVLYGGVQLDQDSIATTRLSKTLTIETGNKTQVLNISAGSWGPDNCAAYLNKHGLFNARMLFLVVSSHDAHDNMDFQKVVGISQAYPDHQYFSSIYEAWDRYVWPRYIKPKLFNGSKPKSQAEEEIRKAGKEFNSGFSSLLQIANENNIPFVIYLHPEVTEVEAGQYNDQGQEIIDFATTNGVQLIREMDFGIDKSWYLDQIHMNAKGQREMANILEPILRQYLN